MNNLKIPFLKCEEVKGWKNRVKLWFRAIACQVQRVALYADSDIIAVGWLDTKTGITHLTWMDNFEPKEVLKKKAHCEGWK